MTNSQNLLAQYALNGSEAAFQELVARYVNLVYSTALRLVGGDRQLAQDVTQTVFINLARKARVLSSGVMPGGWLHQNTYHVATKALRSERRRQSREREAVEMNTLQEDSGATWRDVAPVLDEAITQLGREDRAAILLRFFEQRDYRSVGEALQANEDAARMRVNRALEKLRILLKHRGVTLSAAGLGTMLATEAITAAPAGLAAVVPGVALAGAAAGIGTTFTLFKLMTATQFKFAISTLVVAGATTVLVVQHQAQITLRQENQSLQQQITQLQSDNASLSRREATAKLMLRLPAPHVQAATPPPAAPAEESTNLYARFNAVLKDGPPKLTTAQVEAYLKANGRNASSLLAAYRTSSDPAPLKEAMEKYPNDPRVVFESVLAKDLSPEEQRDWLNTFEKRAPDNALANYLSAFNYFQAGQTDQAVPQLIAASGKGFYDYTPDRVQDDAEAYLSAGYSVAEAGILATDQLKLPHLDQLRLLGQDLVALAKAYNQSGDQASAQAALQVAMNLGQHYSGDATAMGISQLVGLNIERMALSAMDPNSPYGGNGQTVQDQLSQIDQQRATYSDLVAQIKPLLPIMSDQDFINYLNRRRVFGEVATMQWLVSKYGQK